MLDDEKPYDFELKHALKYLVKGEEVEAQFITLSSHSSRHVEWTAELKQAVFRALPEPKEGAEPEGDPDHVMTGTELLFLFYNAKNVSLKQVLLLAKELFTAKPSIALVDGEERLTKPLIDAMHPDDFESMMGEYIARFIIASAFAMLKKL